MERGNKNCKDCVSREYEDIFARIYCDDFKMLIYSPKHHSCPRFKTQGHEQTIPGAEAAR